MQLYTEGILPADKDNEELLSEIKRYENEGYTVGVEAEVIETDSYRETIYHLILS